MSQSSILINQTKQYDRQFMDFSMKFTDVLVEDSDFFDASQLLRFTQFTDGFELKNSKFNRMKVLDQGNLMEHNNLRTMTMAQLDFLDSEITSAGVFKLSI